MWIRPERQYCYSDFLRRREEIKKLIDLTQPTLLPSSVPVGKYIINLKLTKYSRWKSSGWLVYNLGRLELTVIAGQFGLLCREAYRKVSKQASVEASN